MSQNRVRCTAGLLIAAATGFMVACGTHEIRRTSAIPVWVPASTPQVASIDNSASYAFAASPDYDTLVFEENFSAGGEPHHRLTWILGIPVRSVYNQRLEVDDEEIFGWLLEARPGEQTHAVRLTGTVTLRHRDADTVTTTVDLRAPGPAPVAGQVSRPYRVLAQKIVWERRSPTVPRHTELGTTSGIPHD